jgi:hypothetical protein
MVSSCWILNAEKPTGLFQWAGCLVGIGVVGLLVRKGFSSLDYLAGVVCVLFLRIESADSIR